MAGFSLPKLRWLVVGAVAAGFWAMTQEPPSRSRSDTASRPKASVQRQAAMPATPRKAVTPKPRPSPVHTASIPRPEKPVGKDNENALFTTARVHLRARASTSAGIVTTLNPGQKIGLLARDGKWRLVLASGQKGWVHGDYLGVYSNPPRSAAITPPRPPQPVAAKPALSAKSALSRLKGVFIGSRYPARAPQGGDCQCPYDLMLNGKQCGDHSAYSRYGPTSVQCYL